MIKPNLTRTYDQKIPTQDYGEVRLAITVNAWLPQEIDPAEDELRAGMKAAAAAVERVLFDTPELGKPACRDCRFFNRSGEQCRRRSPVFIDRPLVTGFAHTHPDDWCGEFEPSPGRTA